MADGFRRTVARPTVSGWTGGDIAPMPVFRMTTVPGIAVLAVAVGLAAALFAEGRSDRAAADRIAALAEAGYCGAARDRLAAFRETCGDSALVRRLRSEIAFHHGDAASARRHLDEALDADAGDARTHWLLARVLGVQARKANMVRRIWLVRRGFDHLDHAIALDSAFTRARQDRLQALLLVPGWLGGSVEAARAEARHLAALDPWEGGKAWARFYRMTGRPDSAVAVYREALRRYPDDPQFRLGLAESWRDMGRIDSALAVCRMARGVALPEQVLLHAALLDGRGAHVAAESLRVALADRHPGHVGAALALAAAAERSGRHLAAARAALHSLLDPERCRHAGPSPAELWYRLGRLEASDGMPIAARRCFRNALRADPGFQPARRALNPPR